MLQKLLSDNYSLCLSHTVNETNNVVTAALPPKGRQAYGTTNQFSWKVKYFVAGSQKPWTRGGVEVAVGSDVLEIDSGHRYKLMNWGFSPPTVEPPLPNAFQFQVVEVDAAPVVFLDQVSCYNGTETVFSNGPTPIYMAENLVLYPGVATLTPKQAAIVYFKQRAETSGSIPEIEMYLPQGIDFAERPDGQTLILGKNRQWTKE